MRLFAANTLCFSAEEPVTWVTPLTGHMGNTFSVG